MGRAKVKILRANYTGIVLEFVVGKDYRFSIPEAVRGLLTVGDRVKVTIETVKTNETS